MREFNAEIPLADRPLTVRINARVDMLTGDLTWHLIAVDAQGNMPPADPAAGFLDPGVGGSVLFSVLPKKGIPTGTVVTNQAEITFDYNAPMLTNTWSNTLDSDPPISKVAKLAATQTTSKFTVKWPLATDIGSGVKEYTIYVSTDNGPFQPWLTNTTLTRAAFTGIGGHKYGFYSIARDNAYNLEPPKTAAETTTSIKLCPDHVTLNPSTVPGSLNSTGTVVLTGPAPTGGATIALSSSTPSTASTPSTISIPEGQTTGDFPITTTAVSTKTPVKITAKYNTISKSATLNIRPIGVLSVLLNPTTVKGGNQSTGTVTLEAPAAPADITVALTSSNTSIASTPSTITIPAGQSTGQFTIQTTTVTATKKATIKATANAIYKSAILTVTK